MTADLGSFSIPTPSLLTLLWQGKDTDLGMLRDRQPEADPAPRQSNPSPPQILIHHHTETDPQRQTLPRQTDTHSWTRRLRTDKQMSSADPPKHCLIHQHTLTWQHLHTGIRGCGSLQQAAGSSTGSGTQTWAWGSRVSTLKTENSDSPEGCFHSGQVRVR